MASVNVITPDNLGAEFVVSPPEITLNIGSGLSKSPAGVISRDDIIVYEKIVIWAEESAALSNNTAEYSFGNGAAGNIGIPLVEDWELYGVTFNANASSAGASLTMEIMNFTNNSVLLSVPTPNNFGVTNNYVSVVSGLSVQLTEGMTLGFRTDVQSGTISNARVAAWLRREVTV